MKFIYNLQTDSGFQNPDVWLQLIAVIGVWLFGETNPPWLFGEINPDNRENAVGWFQVTISSIARFIATENVRNYIPAGPSQRIDSCSKNVLAQDGSEEDFICFTWKIWILLTVLYLWSASAGPLAMWRSGIPNCSQRCVLVEPVDTKRIESLEKFCDLEKELPLQGTSIYTSKEEWMLD